MLKLFCSIFFSFLFLTSVYAADVKTVITQGVGKDVESATQRAAEAALIQVVGSFIDSTKLIEKRKEIRDGIRTRIKSISSKLSEYSQGSIKRLDVLEVAQEDGLTRVTTKVIVRIEDFKHYIKKTVLAERKIKTGLLAKMKLGKKQGKNLFDLLSDKVIRPVFEYKVVIPKLGEIRQVTNSKNLAQFSPYMETGEYLVSFDVEVKLNQNYLANASRVLEEIAEKRYPCRKYKKDRKTGRHPAHSAIIGFGVVGKKITDKTLHDRGEWQNCNSGAQEVFGDLGKTSTIYGFPANQINLCSRLYKEFGISKGLVDVIDSGGSYGNVFKPFLQLKWMSASGTVVKRESFSTKKLYKLGGISLLTSGDSFIVNPKGISIGNKNSWVVYSFLPALISWGNTKVLVNNGENSCSFFIKKHAKFRIFSKVTEEVLSKTNKVVLSYAQQ
jgi:hypothetical protein